MASEKISAMPNLAGGQIPTDLVPLVDLSAVPASQNVKSTLNDLFAVITKNVSDGALRYRAPGSAPSLAAVGEGSIYFDGTNFRVSENGGSYRLIVHAGLITASGLTQATARILGRTTAGTGAVEEITIGANLSLAAGSLAVTGVVLPGAITSSGLTQSTARILGRTTAGTGAVEEITIGSGLTLAGGQLSASGGGGAPGGSITNIQYNAGSGSFGGSNNFVFNAAASPTVDLLTTGAAVTALRVTGNASQTAEVAIFRQGGDNGAPILTLQQGVLSSNTANFPFRFENASGTLIAGLQAIPLQGWYRWVIPGQANNQAGYVVGALGSGSGLGIDASGAYPTLFASGAAVAWGNGTNANLVLNQAALLVWSTAAAINSPNTGLYRIANAHLRITNGTTGSSDGGGLTLGDTTSTSAVLRVEGAKGGVEATAIIANRTALGTSGTSITASFVLTAAPTGAATGAVYVGANCQVTGTTSQQIGALYGLQNIAWHQGTNAVSTVAGLKCFGYNSQGVVTNLAAIDAQVQSLDVGLITNASGIVANVFRSAGTITNAYGINITTVQGTNAYGLNIAGVSGSLFTAGIYVAAALTNYAGSATWSVISDQRVKENIRDYDRGLDTVLALNPRMFEYNGKGNTVAGRTGISLIAQEALSVMPETLSEMPVTLNPDDTDTTTIYTLNAAPLIYACINAIKELHARTTTIESKVITSEIN